MDSRGHVVTDYNLRLEPVSWVQEIRDYPSIKVEGQYLRVSCKPEPGTRSDLRLSNNAKLTDLTAELGIVAGEQPLDAHGKPLKQGIGDFRFHEEMPLSDDGLPGMDAFLSGFLYLKPDSYLALWEQVRDGDYAGCDITINIGPVKSEGLGWVWDVSQHLTISTAAIAFRRTAVADKPATQAAHRKSFFEWLNPSAAADAEHDAAVVEILNQDVEKRRRNAWLRKISFIGRIVVYACLFLALFFFRPEGLSEITSKPLARLAIGNIVGAVVWVIIALLLLNALFKPNPRPDFQEAWGVVSVVVLGAALVLGMLFLYLRA
jgi:hypothetical protein